MSRNRIDYSCYSVIDVTDKSGLWEGKDPVRPWLSSHFRVSSGRKVYSLTAKDGGEHAAFLCLARTSNVPEDEAALKSLSDPNGKVAVPYTVWSYKPGAGREIVSRVLEIAKEDTSIERVVTLSPVTAMAKSFHIKNGAVEVKRNIASINFEYKIDIGV